MCSRNIRKLCDNLTIIYLTTQVQEQNQLIRIELYIREHWPFLSIKLIKIELLVSVGRSINAALINQEIRGRLNFVQREERVQRVVFQTDIHAFLDSNWAYSRYFSPVDRNQLPRYDRLPRIHEILDLIDTWKFFELLNPRSEITEGSNTVRLLSLDLKRYRIDQGTVSLLI